MVDMGGTGTCCYLYSDTDYRVVQTIEWYRV
jgi:hypothetical protein